MTVIGALSLIRSFMVNIDELRNLILPIKDLLPGTNYYISSCIDSYENDHRPSHLRFASFFLYRLACGLTLKDSDYKKMICDIACKFENVANNSRLGLMSDSQIEYNPGGQA